MIESIINFFKNLFGFSSEKNKQAISNTDELNPTETRVKTKLLINNCLKGYKLKDMSLITGSYIMYCEDVSEGGFAVTTFETDKMPEEFYLRCKIESNDCGEQLGPLGMVVENRDSFLIINVTDTSLGLRKIAFDTTVESSDIKVQKNLD